jgi:glycosyltransferase involved in cell wall biosynthesis
MFAILARAFGMKVVVTNHGPDYDRTKWSFPAKIFLRFCEKIGSTFANEIVAITPNIAKSIKENYGRDSRVIPNGVDIPNVIEMTNFLNTLGVERKKYILAVGRIVPEKGFDDLLEAFHIAQLEDWKLVIAGDTDHESNYSRNFKDKAKKHKNIILHAGLFVLPSYHEGLPIALLEAMSYGTSCIASDIPANRNVELDDDRFFLVGDVKQLSEKISVFTHIEWGENERKKQIQTIAEKYNWKKIAEETLDVYKKVIAGVIILQ